MPRYVDVGPPECDSCPYKGLRKAGFLSPLSAPGEGGSLKPGGGPGALTRTEEDVLVCLSRKPLSLQGESLQLSRQDGVLTRLLPTCYSFANIAERLGFTHSSQCALRFTIFQKLEERGGA